MFISRFECIACGKTWDPDFSLYLCPACGNNLDILYDYERILACAPKEDLFARGSGLARYALLLPMEDPGNLPRLAIGNTPLYRADRLEADYGFEKLFLKDDGLQPSASFKDRASAVIATQAVERKAAMIVGASTGNAGSSMACMAASMGISCAIFVPESAPAAKLTQLRIFGARVIAVRGTYDDAFDLCLEASRRGNLINRNTGYNPSTREGKKTCLFEIWEQLGREMPDWIVVPSGDGNIISGIWKGVRDLAQLGLVPQPPRLACIQAESSASITRTLETLPPDKTPDWAAVKAVAVEPSTVADSISVALPRDGIAAVRAVHESKGIALTVSDEEILAALQEMATRQGVFAEPAAAAAWAGAKKMIGSSRISQGERVVILVTGNGLKDVQAAQRIAPEPITIDADIEAAVQALGTD